MSKKQVDRITESNDIECMSSISSVRKNKFNLNPEFDSIESLLRYIEDLYKYFNRTNKKENSTGKKKYYKSHPIMLFRGQPNYLDKLVPSVFRDNNLLFQENLIFRKLYSIHSDEFESDTNTFDKLVRMQHYGLPTRLLDITENPLVAMYFASQSAKKQTDGALFIFILQEMYIKSYDSDTVSIISNFAKLRTKEWSSLLSGNEDLTYKNSLKRLLSEIRKENPSFEDEIDFVNLPDFCFVEAKKNNKRIKSQSGSFIIFKRNVEDIGTSFSLPYKNVKGEICQFKGICIKAKIPYKMKKKKILPLLDKMNINAKNIYQDISNTALYIKDKAMSHSII